MPSSQTSTVSRSLHDLGAASWFGGSLMGALGVNGASKDVSDPTERARIAASGWARWSPVAAASIAAHGVGALALLVQNRDRIGRQQGVGTNTAWKAAATLAAVGTTAYSGVLGARLAKATQDQPQGAEGGTVPTRGTSSDVAAIQQQLRILQWVTPVLTGVVIVLGAQQGEQQTVSVQVAGTARKALDDLQSRVRG